MLGQLFAAFGGFIGKMAGGGIISTALKYAGTSLGNYLAREFYTASAYHHYKKSLDNIEVISDTNGKTIPLIFGKIRVEARIIWALNLKEVAIKDTDARYFHGSSKIKSLIHSTEYIYYADFALGICEGPVDHFHSVWINGQETDIEPYKFRFYKGNDEQLPDNFIEAAQGKDKTPAFRGLCYIIFENFPLADFGNKIPHFSFEITRKPQNNSSLSVEEMIQNIVIIPGSGEFIYDTLIQDKIIYSSKGNIELYREYINCHNPKHVADSIYNLDELQSLCTNLKWAAPVVCWFADNLDASKANIFPAIEHNDPSFKTTEEWLVAGVNRASAKVISRDEDNIPNYGGTVNDRSLLRYLDELKSRNIKIMLYPMIFLDIPGKPWRGHITAFSDGIRRFFNHEAGYKNFILHYAKLVRGRVDAFVIGSELKSMTKVREDNIFPAVLELIDLAEKVKEILGPNVKVTYAADWSEYHHTDGGIYNLDLLWACDSIDIIGIDAYFPLTNSADSNIDIHTIKSGWSRGEGWDYYMDGESKEPLSPQFAWKNIEYWWKNPHINPDGTITPWIPKSKKIWFTEFGFPSIDKGSNQPNIFFDPKSLDGGMPRYSSGEVDFAIQRKSIKATIEFWQNSEFIENMFLWTWDARPYPAWPHGKIWRDSNLWLKGHWINGKLYSSSLANIIIELCVRSGINPANVNVDTIDDNLDGMLLDNQSSIWDVINCVRVGYFFDIRSDYQKSLAFIKRGRVPSISLDIARLVNNKKIIDIEYIASRDRVSEISISFIDNINSYNQNIIHKASNNISNIPICYLHFPVVMDELSANIIAEKILASANLENKIFNFTLLISELSKICAGNIILLQLCDMQYKIRISEVVYERLLCHVTGILIDVAIYNKTPKLEHVPDIELDPISNLEIFELPVSLKAAYGNSIYAASSTKHVLYSLLGDKMKIADLREGIIAVVIEIKANPEANSFVTDAISEFIIYSTSSIKDQPNRALIGGEVIYFTSCKQISANIYSIKQLVRGCLHTESHIQNHLPGEKFILLDTISEISATDITIAL